MDYLDARRLAFEAGRAGRKPDLGMMFSLYGRGGGSGGSSGDERRAEAKRRARIQEQYDREDAVRNETFAQQVKLAGIRHNAPQTPEELAAHMERKRQEAALLGKTFDQQKELLALKQSGVLGAIAARGNEARQTEGVKQANRVDLEGTKQTNRKELASDKRTFLEKMFGLKAAADTEKQKADIEAKMARLQAQLQDKALSREERAWYHKEMVRLGDERSKLASDKFSFSKWFEPKKEEGRNERAAAAQAGATQRKQMAQEGANQRSAASIASREKMGNANRDAAMERHYNYLMQRSNEVEARLQDRSLDRASREALAREANDLRRSIAEMNNETRISTNNQNNATRRDIADLNETGRNDRAEADRQVRLYEGSANRDQRAQISEADRQARLYNQSANRDMRVSENEKARAAAASRQATGLSAQSARDWFKSMFQAGEKQKDRDLRKSEGAATRAQRDKESAARQARFAVSINTRLGRAFQSSDKSSQAASLTRKAADMASLELLQAGDISPDEEAAIIEKHARALERVFQNRSR